MFTLIFSAPGAPSESLASRARFNSLGSNVILGTASKSAERPAQFRSASAMESPLQDSDPLKDASHISHMSCLISEELLKPPLPAPPNTTTGSIATRAMRSMRSVARLTNWSNGKTMEKDTTLPMPPVKKHKQPADVKRNKKTENRKFDSNRDQMTLRHSGSSSEPGVTANINTPPIQASTMRKHGVLGLGFPSGFRFGTLRSSSAGSSSQITTGFDNTPSFDRGRSSSTVSAASSMKPASAISSSSSTPVRWLEKCPETVKVARRERIAERPDELHGDSKEPRRQGAIVDMFPEHWSGPVSSTSASSGTRSDHTSKETSGGGHFVLGSELMATPCTQIRVRPASDQMIDKERLRSIRHDPDGEPRTIHIYQIWPNFCTCVGALSALDAATNELASLINRLDLEATPGTPRGTLRLSPSFTNLLAESPRLNHIPEKNGSSMALPIHANTASLTSVRPCLPTQLQEDPLNTRPFGQQIAPWPVSPACVPPPISSTDGSSVVDASLTCERSAAKSESSFEFRPPWLAKTKKPSQSAPVASMLPLRGCSSTVTTTSVPAKPPPIKFRSMSKKKSVGPLADSRKESQLSNTFRKVMSTLSLRPNKEIEMGLSPDLTGVPISKEAQKDLGLAGTLGGSMSSRNPDRSTDHDDPSSDIPNELQVILSGGDTFTYLPPFLQPRPPSPGLPPKGPLPIPAVLQASIAPSDRQVISVPWKDEARPEDHDESDLSSLEENDTRKSFDFTSELKSLSESAGSHRRSFVEQLENAFRTPAKYDLDGYDHFESEVPPMPAIHHLTSMCPGDPNAVVSSPVPPLLPSPEIIESRNLTSVAASHDLSQVRVQKSSASSKSSYGQLNLNFKFGGTPLSTELAASSQLTLSDIIPSPAHARSLSMASLQDDGPPRQSAEPQSMSAPSSYLTTRRRANSDSSLRHPMYGDSRVDGCSLHSRASSQISFKGLESFDEIRRGFEFVENRPAFYPPPSFNRSNQMPRDSMISMASVSSYGMIINPGVKDPFDYGYQSRPASADMSTFVTMSTSVDDTFSFIRRGPRRKRVDSDSSSFYFRAPGTSRISRPLKSQFRRDSTAIAPPVSIYNRSFGVHRGIDSASGVGPDAHAGGDRSSWAPSHRRELSADSVMSDISVRIPRPNLGDKMLDSRHDYCLPLRSITASPPESVPSYRRVRSQSSFDSIMDDERLSYSRDSIMDQSDRRTSTTSESVFGQDGSHSMHPSLDQFRIHDDPRFSLFSAEGDSADPKREDDTMISVGVLSHNLNLIMYVSQMIGGGRVRRRSMSSFVEGSPIFVRVGKRKPVVSRGQQRHIVQQCEEVLESPIVAQKVESSPNGLGEERMISARQGLFSRDSLEEHCLCADGIDTSCESIDFVSVRPTYRLSSHDGTCFLSPCTGIPFKVGYTILNLF